LALDDRFVQGNKDLLPSALSSLLSNGPHILTLILLIGYELFPMSYELIMDNGGRRTGMDRRHFSYADHIPERRSGYDRRTGSARRSGQDRRSLQDRRSGQDRRQDSAPSESEKVVELRSGRDRRTPSDRRRALERRVALA